METTEKIVEAYVRYVKGWFTIPNIKCGNQKEIDLLAVDVRGGKTRRYHIESGVSISKKFSKLTNADFSVAKLKSRAGKAVERRKLSYFIRNKFLDPHVLEGLSKFKFTPMNTQRIIVTWGWRDEALIAATNQDVVLWDFRELLQEIAALGQLTSHYYTDDTVRTVQLVAKAQTRTRQ